MEIFKKLNQNGFSHELIMLVIVISSVTAVGGYVISRSHAETTEDTGGNSQILAPDQQSKLFRPKGLPTNTPNSASLSTQSPSPGASCYPNICYYYNSMTMGGISATGAKVSFTTAKPGLGSKDYHSITELAVESADGQQVVEVGWTVDKGLNGDSSPHLFVYHWVNGGSTCYNACGFVQVSTTIRPGALLAAGTIGTYKIAFTNNKWWVYYKGQQVGYFPASLWRGTFTKLGLVQVFGEVAASPSALPHTKMGNGVLGTKSGSAVISGLSLINPSNSSTLSYNDFGTRVYKIGSHNDFCTSLCGMHYGGPGY